MDLAERRDRKDVVTSKDDRPNTQQGEGRSCYRGDTKKSRRAAEITNGPIAATRELRKVGSTKAKGEAKSVQNAGTDPRNRGLDWRDG